MLAVYAARVGGDDPLANLEVGDRPAPEPEPGWAVVRVRAASLNHHDLWTLRGVSSATITPPQILGCDGAGTVEGYGGAPPTGGGPEPGTRVVGYPGVTCGRCAARLSDEPMARPSLRMLCEPPLAGAFPRAPGDDDRRRVAVDLGAEAACPVARETARDLIAATGGVGVDAVIDSVGEPTWELSLRAVRPGGVVVVPGATGGRNPPAQLNRIFFRSVTIAGTTMGTRGELRRLVDLVATGALRPLIGSTHTMRDARPSLPEA